MESVKYKRGFRDEDGVRHKTPSQRLKKAFYAYHIGQGCFEIFTRGKKVGFFDMDMREIPDFINFLKEKGFYKRITK